MSSSSPPRTWPRAATSPPSPVRHPRTAAGAPPRRPSWWAAATGVLVGAAGLGLLVVGVGTTEHLLVGGETREWCEGTKGYDSNHGPVERCVRERDETHVIASDEHVIELYRGESGGDRYEVHAWPLRGEDVEVDFAEDSVTVRDGHGISATYPNSVFDDAR